MILAVKEISFSKTNPKTKSQTLKAQVERLNCWDLTPQIPKKGGVKVTNHGFFLDRGIF
jgi:hypothetical protein